MAPPWLRDAGRTLASVALLVALEIALRQAFQAMHAKFPSAFAGMLLVIFVLVVTTPRRRPYQGGEDGKPLEHRPSPLYRPLKPGKDFLVRWLPTFFAPGIISMPNSEARLPPLDLVKVVAVALIGFEITLYSTAKCALVLSAWRRPACCRHDKKAAAGATDISPRAQMDEEMAGGEPMGRQGGSQVSFVLADGSSGDGDEEPASGLAEPETATGPIDAPHNVDDNDDDASSDASIPAPPRLHSRVSRTDSIQPPPPPFSGRLHAGLGLVTLASAVASILIARLHLGFDAATSPWALPETLFTFALTLLCYVTGARAPARFRRVINPIISGSLLALLCLYLHGLATGRTLNAELGAYLTNNSPMDFNPHTPYRWVGGGGDILFYALQPSVLALGVATYENFRVAWENKGVVLGTLAFATLFSLFTSAALARALVLPRATGAATLARNITAPLAAMIAEMLNVDVPITLLAVFTSSLYGVLVGDRRLRWYRMDRDFIVKGMAIGVSSHGLGTASLVNEPEAMAFSAIGFLLCGILTVLLFTIQAACDFFYSIA